jgi:hypothetical protein
MQLTLFPAEPTPTAPYVRNSVTSKAAAESIGPTLNEKQRIVYEYIKSCGSYGCTDEELIEAMMKRYGWSPNTPRARRIEATEKGWLKENGTRTTKFGRNAVVWVAKGN